jgi:hypothetical protein
MKVRRVAKPLAAIAAVLLALWLYVDSMTWSLYAADPATGRVRGCFTAIELWIGVSNPSWVRFAELVVALILLIAALATAVRALQRRVRGRFAQRLSHVRRS